VAFAIAMAAEKLVVADRKFATPAGHPDPSAAQVGEHRSFAINISSVRSSRAW
jgi:hypothetical protein